MYTNNAAAARACIRAGVCEGICMDSGARSAMRFRPLERVSSAGQQNANWDSQLQRCYSPNIDSTRMKTRKRTLEDRLCRYMYEETEIFEAF